MRNKLGRPVEGIQTAKNEEDELKDSPSAKVTHTEVKSRYDQGKKK